MMRCCVKMFSNSIRIHNTCITIVIASLDYTDHSERKHISNVYCLYVKICVCPVSHALYDIVSYTCVNILGGYSTQSSVSTVKVIKKAVSVNLYTEAVPFPKPFI